MHLLRCVIIVLLLACANAYAQQSNLQAQLAVVVEQMKLGTAAHGVRDFSRALDHYQKALAAADQIADERMQSRLPRLLDAIGECHRTLGNNADSIPYYQRSLALREKFLGADNPEV